MKNIKKLIKNLEIQDQKIRQNVKSGIFWKHFDLHGKPHQVTLFWNLFRPREQDDGRHVKPEKNQNHFITQANSDRKIEAYQWFFEAMAEADDYESLPATTPFKYVALAGAAAGVAEHVALFPVDSVKVGIEPKISNS